MLWCFAMWASTPSLVLQEADMAQLVHLIIADDHGEALADILMSPRCMHGGNTAPGKVMILLVEVNMNNGSLRAVLSLLSTTVEQGSR